MTCRYSESYLLLNAYWLLIKMLPSLSKQVKCIYQIQAPNKQSVTKKIKFLTTLPFRNTTKSWSISSREKKSLKWLMCNIMLGNSHLSKSCGWCIAPQITFPWWMEGGMILVLSLSTILIMIKFHVEIGPTWKINYKWEDQSGPTYKIVAQNFSCSLHLSCPHHEVVLSSFQSLSSSAYP